MVDFKKDSWFYALISVILAIVSLFTPACIFYNSPDGDLIRWLGGGIMLEIDTGIWHEDFFSQLLFGATLISIASLLAISINTMRGNNYKWDWLIYLLSGIIVILLTIFFWFFDFDPALETISFASIGIFISGIISVLASIIGKLSIKRNE